MGLSKFDCGRIIGSIVALLQPTQFLHHETKLSLLRLCARLTRNYENAQIFIRCGGVRMILQLQQSCSFMGFPTYAIIILRHVLEAPPVLQEAMERVLGMRAAGIVPVGHRDLIYVLTQVSTAVSRDPKIFVAAAKEMLKGEYVINANNSNLVEDGRVMVKSKFGQQPTAAATATAGTGGTTAAEASAQLEAAAAAEAAKEDQFKEDPRVQASVAVVKELLLALVQPCCHYNSTAAEQQQNAAAELLLPDQPPGASGSMAMDDEVSAQTRGDSLRAIEKFIKRKTT